MTTYAIKLLGRPKDNCYVNWCNERWYSTDGDPSPRFTEATANKIVNYLPNHYCYNFAKIGSDGSYAETHVIKKAPKWDFSVWDNKDRVVNENKKSIFKLNSKIILKK